jgi:hypothetical protein
MARKKVGRLLLGQRLKRSLSGSTQIEEDFWEREKA